MCVVSFGKFFMFFYISKDSVAITFYKILSNLYIKQSLHPIRCRVLGWVTLIYPSSYHGLPTKLCQKLRKSQPWMALLQYEGKTFVCFLEIFLVWSKAVFPGQQQKEMKKVKTVWTNRFNKIENVAWSNTLFYQFRFYKKKQ